MVVGIVVVVVIEGRPFCAALPPLALRNTPRKNGRGGQRGKQRERQEGSLESVNGTARDKGPDTAKANLFFFFPVFVVFFFY